MRVFVLIVLVLGIASKPALAEPQTTSDKIPGTLLKIDLVKIPAGKVEIVRPDGAKKRLEIKPIWMGRTEVTWELYDCWIFGLDVPEERRIEETNLGTRPSKPFHLSDHGFGHDGFAVIGVHSKAAGRFCAWLSEKTGRKYRLPTEAEWEYACRAGADEEPFAGAEQLKEIAWCRENSETELEELVAHAVGQKRANAWGLHDMLGNVGEWVIAADDQPVVKGGSFRMGAARMNSRVREPFNPRWQLSDPEFPKSQWWMRDAPHVSFRVVREE